MKKKLIAILLILSVLVSNMGYIGEEKPLSFAYDAGVLSDELKAMYLAYPNDVERAITYVEEQLTTATFESRYGLYEASIAILKDFGKVVYIKPEENDYDYSGFGDKQKGDDGKWHYKYLGRTWDENTFVTNALYPNVGGTSTLFSTYQNKQWIPLPENYDTWSVPERKVMEYMLNDKGTRAQDNGVFTGTHDLSVKDLVNHRLTGSKALIDELRDLAKYQATSTLKYWGSVMLEHELPTNGNRYYRTVDVNPVPFGEPVLTITPEFPEYVFAENEQTKTMQVDAVVDIEGFTPFNGWSLSNYIEKADITVEGENAISIIEGNQVKATFNITIDRDDYVIGDKKAYPIKGSFKLIAHDYFNKDEFAGDGTGTHTVLVNAGEVEADFDIKYDGKSVKDSVIAFDNWKDFNLTLDPNIQINGENEVTSIVWAFESSGADELVEVDEEEGVLKNVSYVMNEAKKDTHLIGDVATFKMTANLKYDLTDVDGNTYSQITKYGTVTFSKDKIPTLPSGLPPVAKLQAPSRVRVGDPFIFSGANSYDPDGYITDFDFSATAHRIIEYYNTDHSSGKAVINTNTASNTFMTVTDNTGMTDQTSKPINLLPPIEADMKVLGRRKVNRKVTLDASGSLDALYFPVDSYTWSILPLQGQQDSSIKWDTTNEGESINVLFKEPGAYQISLDLHADCTYPGDEMYQARDSISYPIMIQEDEKPVAQLTTLSMSLRDKMDAFKASIDVVDTSYSTDGDLTRTRWFYTFDSDNDGSITDEVWTAFGRGQSHEIFKASKVGDYYFYNVTTDVIPEDETIRRFLADSDYMTDNSLDQAAIQRMCEVENVAPVISTSVELNKEVDLLVLTDESGTFYTSLVSEVNDLRKQLFERKIQLNPNIVDLNTLAPMTLGMMKELVYKWYRYINMHWEWNYKYATDGITGSASSGTKTLQSVIETRQGTIDDMTKFPVYPDAYASLKERGRGGSGFNGSVKWVNAEYDVYNGPYDYFTSVSQPRDIYWYYNGPSLRYWYANDHKWANKSGKWWDGNGDAHAIWNNLELPNSIHATVDSAWSLGEYVSERDASYNVHAIESYIEAYKDSPNDKYLIFAYANGTKLFLPDALKAKIEQYGFKVYFSIDEAFGEFTPKVPNVAKVSFQNDSLYALTKFGNQLKNHSLDPVDKVMYEYDISKSESIDYDHNSMTLEKFRNIGRTLTEYSTGSSARMVAANGTRMDAVHGYTPSGYFSNYGISEDGRWKPLRANYNPRYELWDNLHRNRALRRTFSANSTWLMDTGESLNVDTFFQANYNAVVAKTSDNKYYYVTNEIKESKGNNITSYELPISGIESIQAVTAWDWIWKHQYHWATWMNPQEYQSQINHYPMNTELILIEDTDGLYHLLYTDLSYASASGPYLHHVRTDIKHFVLNNLSALAFAVEWYTLTGDNMSWLGGGFKGGIPPEITGFEVTPSYPYDGSTTASRVYSYPFADFTSRSIKGTKWTLLDTNGDLYVDGKLFETGVLDSDLKDYYTHAYVTSDGIVHAKGKSPSGALGDFNTHNTYIQPFNSPYTLNVTYQNESFSSPFDIASQSPAYSVVNRGLYEHLKNVILNEYQDYSTREQVLIQVGDSIDVSANVIDYELDPIYDKRIDVSHDHTYFDNDEGPFIPPDSFENEVVIDKPGRMEIRVRAQDNPVGGDERFSEYRYWNKDKTTIEVIAHRKPIAQLGVALVPQGDGTFNFVGSDNGSYDLDHSVSRPDKGIVESKHYYRKELESFWTEYDGTMPIIEGVQYHFALRVKDVEGAWSDYDIESIRIDGEPFIVTADTAPPYPTGIPAGQTVRINAKVFTYKTVGEVQANVDGLILKLPKTSQAGMESTYSVLYTVPATKADRDYYDIILTATSADGTSRRLPLKLNVLTPLNITGEVSPYELGKGDTGTLTAQTNHHATSVEVDLFAETTNETRVRLNKGIKVGQVQNWSATYVFNQNMGEGEYEALFTAATTNGNSAEYTDTFRFVPNQPPIVSFDAQTPAFAYEGDDVTFDFTLTDPDGDPLDVRAELISTSSESENNDWQLIDSRMNVQLGPSKSAIYSVHIPDVANGDYKLRIKVSDPQNEQAQATTTFSTAVLSVVGQVNHVERWNENRIAFNRSKTGMDDSPRAVSVFWPGERFILQAQSTQLDENATTTCNSVHVEILSKSTSAALSVSPDSPWSWLEELWKEEMMDWQDGPLTFRFTASYSNGVNKTDEVEVMLDNSESYWRIHRLY